MKLYVTESLRFIFLLICFLNLTLNSQFSYRALNFDKAAAATCQMSCFWIWLVWMLTTREQCVVLLLLLWQSNSNGACVETLDWSVSFRRRSEIFISKRSVSLGLCVWSFNTMSQIVQWVCKQIQNTIISDYQQLKHSPGWPWQSLAQVTFLLVESSVKQNTVFI